MSVPPSNAAKLPLPQWAYVPGETAEAEADLDTLWQAMALVPSRFQDFVPARHPALRYGIALNDAGYFWEAQEILEAVWAAAPQGGRERILLRARAAARFFGEALNELDTLGRNAMAPGAGFVEAFPTAALAALLKAKLALPTLAKADWVEFGKIGRA
jgi:DUF309 family protein family protein